MKNNTFLRIAIFYLLAIVLSNIFRQELFGLDKLGQNLPWWLFISTTPLQAIGILLGALIALHLMKKKKKPQYTFFGTSKGFSILITLIPFILVIVFGVKNDSGTNPHVNGVLAAISVLVYCYFEEIGWRGYLHDELRNLKQWQRVLLIGFLWWFWHLGFIGDLDLFRNLTFLSLLIVAAWGLGILIEHTKSVLTVSAFHMVVNILFFNPKIAEGIPQNHRLMITIISTVFWIVLIIFFNKKKTYKS